MEEEGEEGEKKDGIGGGRVREGAGGRRGGVAGARGSQVEREPRASQQQSPDSRLSPGTCDTPPGSASQRHLSATLLPRSLARVLHINLTSRGSDSVREYRP